MTTKSGSRPFKANSVGPALQAGVEEITLASIAAIWELLRIISFLYSPALSAEDKSLFRALSQQPLSREQASDVQSRIRRYRFEDFDLAHFELFWKLAIGEPVPEWDDHHDAPPEDENRITDINGVRVFYSVSDLLTHLQDVRLAPVQKVTNWEIMRFAGKRERKAFSSGALVRFSDHQYADLRFSYALHGSCGSDFPKAWLATRISPDIKVEDVPVRSALWTLPVYRTAKALARRIGLSTAAITAEEPPTFDEIASLLDPKDREMAEHGDMVFPGGFKAGETAPRVMIGLWLVNSTQGRAGRDTSRSR